MVAKKNCCECRRASGLNSKFSHFYYSKIGFGIGFSWKLLYLI